MSIVASRCTSLVHVIDRKGRALPGPSVRYSPYVKDQVRKRYHLCRTTEDKRALAKELDILDETGDGDVSKLYNLASRLKAAGKKDGSTPVVADELLHQLRLDPATTKFTADAERYLKHEFGRRTETEIAYHLKLSVPAVLVKARHLGLRQLTKHWELSDVAAWLGMTEDELRALAHDKVSLDIFELYHPGGQRKHEVVSLTSLIRWLHTPDNREKVEARNPDRFFLMEIDESLEALRSGTNSWEKCKFLSAGHRCMNSYATLSHGLFCTNNEKWDAGADPNCIVRSLEIYDLRRGD